MFFFFSLLVVVVVVFVVVVFCVRVCVFFVCVFCVCVLLLYTSLYQQVICVMGNSGTFPPGKAGGAVQLPGCLVHSYHG